MKHTVNEINMSYMNDTTIMACKLAMATIHSIYDENMDSTYISDVEMHKVEKAMKVLCMAKDFLNGNQEKKAIGLGVIK